MCLALKIYRIAQCLLSVWYVFGLMMSRIFEQWPLDLAKYQTVVHDVWRSQLISEASRGGDFSESLGQADIVYNVLNSVAVKTTTIFFGKIGNRLC